MSLNNNILKINGIKILVLIEMKLRTKALEHVECKGILLRKETKSTVCTTKIIKSNLVSAEHIN
jgi:hypothetical protein